MTNDRLEAEIKLSTFGLYDVWCLGKCEYREVPLVLAQALAYCIEHGISDKDRGWDFEKPLE